jgi:hypothetical protein
MGGSLGFETVSDEQTLPMMKKSWHLSDEEDRE